MTEISAEFRFVPLSSLHESKTNPRRRFDEGALEDLAASARVHGILVPLLVRPIANGDGREAFEIVAGARRFRAATRGGLDLVPVRARPMTDTEVLEIQVIENLQREDVHPLDEALGYRALLDASSSYDVAAIAAKVGKSESYVYQRLKLADLIPAAQKPFLEGELTAGHAILIARLQPHDQQRALEAAIRPHYAHFGEKVHKAAVPVRELAAWIQRELHLDLHAAPFDKRDAELVAAAGACTVCPKRSGFTPALFADLGKKDVCTDPSCFKGKIDAHTAAKREELKSKGERFLEISTAYTHKKPKDGEPLPDPFYHRIEGKKDRCASSVPALVVQGDRDLGRVVSACVDPKCSKHRSGSDDDYIQRSRAESKARDRKVRIEKESRQRILAAVLAKVSWPLPRKDLEAVAIAFYGDVWNEHRKALAQRLGWEAKKRKYGGASYDADLAARYVPKLTDEQLGRVLIALAVSRSVEVHAYSIDKPTALLDLARRYRVDGEKIRAQVVSEAKARDAEKKARERKKAKASAGATDVVADFDQDEDLDGDLQTSATEEASA